MFYFYISIAIGIGIGIGIRIGIRIGINQNQITKDSVKHTVKKNSIKTNTPNSSHEGLFIKGMDEYNKKATEVLFTKSEEEFMEHVFKHPETGKPLSYSEMRSFYG